MGLGGLGLGDALIGMDVTDKLWFKTWDQSGGIPGTVGEPVGPTSSLGPCHTQEAWEMLVSSWASAGVPPWPCISTAILGRREQ